MGNLLILGGNSGSGKSTIASALIEEYGYRPLVTVTTRPPRMNEVHGKDYYFISNEEFDKQSALGNLPNQTTYAGVQYGTYKDTVLEILNSKQPTVAVMDINGIGDMERLLKEYEKETNISSKVIAIFVGVDLDVQRERLTKRFDENEKTFLKRQEQQFEKTMDQKIDRLYVLYQEQKLNPKPIDLPPIEQMIEMTEQSLRISLREEHRAWKEKELGVIEKRLSQALGRELTQEYRGRFTGGEFWNTGQYENDVSSITKQIDFCFRAKCGENIFHINQKQQTKPLIENNIQFPKFTFQRSKEQERV